MTEVTTEVVEATVETAVVADYLELVKAEKMQEAGEYLVRFFGEGDNLNEESLKEFQVAVETAVLAEISTEDAGEANADVEVSED